MAEYAGAAVKGVFCYQHNHTCDNLRYLLPVVATQTSWHNLVFFIAGSNKLAAYDAGSLLLFSLTA